MTINFYDAAGRLTKTGAGASGTVDPVESFFNGVTGIMTKARYTSGGNTSDATFGYNTAGQLTSITDWYGGANASIDYAYDDAETSRLRLAYGGLRRSGVPAA